MQNKLMMIIIIVLMVVLVGAVAVFAFFFIRASKTEQAAEVDPVATVIHLTEEEMTDVSMGDSLKTNLSQSVDGSKHMVSVDLSASINNTVKKESDALIVLLTDKQKVMRSVALEVVRKKTVEELERPDGKENLEDEILTKLREQFNTNLIVRVMADNIVTN